jgi:hypothetical protein
MVFYGRRRHDEGAAGSAGGTRQRLVLASARPIARTRGAAMSLRASRLETGET